jgi:hypothetical protein
MRAISIHGLTTAMATGFAAVESTTGAGAGDGYALEPSGMRCWWTAASVACCSAEGVRAASRRSATKPTTTTRPTAQAAMRMFRRSALRVRGVDTAHSPSNALRRMDASGPSNWRGARFAPRAARSLQLVWRIPGDLPVSGARDEASERLVTLRCPSASELLRIRIRPRAVRSPTRAGGESRRGNE